jgi:hypothetical protein
VLEVLFWFAILMDVDGEFWVWRFWFVGSEDATFATTKYIPEFESSQLLTSLGLGYEC